MALFEYLRSIILVSTAAISPRACPPDRILDYCSKGEAGGQHSPKGFVEAVPSTDSTAEFSQKRSRMDGKISPPPLKRRKVENTGEKSEEFEPSRDDMRIKARSSVRVFAWNINGIQPFLPSPESTVPITSFFKPVEGRSRSPDASVAKSRTLGPISNGNPLREFLRRHRWPEVLFLQELKISPTDKKSPKALLATINTSLDQEDHVTEGTRYKVDVNLPRDKHNARGFGGKLYGVGTFLQEDFAKRHVAVVRHADWDLEGRVTIVELKRPQNEPLGTAARSIEEGSVRDIQPQKLRTSHYSFAPLALLNVYAVNGTSAPYRSPGAGKITGTRHDHKLRFHELLRDECLDLERRGFDVVIAGDLNIARGRLDGWPGLRTFPRQHCLNRAHFNTRFFGEEDNERAEAYLSESLSEATRGIETGGEDAFFDGVDVFRALRGKERRYTYHPRSGDEWGTSCDRVDLIVTSRKLVDAGKVLDTDILDSVQERGTSDHVPLWIKIRLAQDTPNSEAVKLP